MVYDVSDPFSVYHLAVTLLQLRQRRFDELVRAFANVREEFIRNVIDPEERKVLEWSQRAQRENHWEEMDAVERAIKGLE